MNDIDFSTVADIEIPIHPEGSPYEVSMPIPSLSCNGTQVWQYSNPSTSATSANGLLTVSDAVKRKPTKAEFYGKTVVSNGQLVDNDAVWECNGNYVSLSELSLRSAGSIKDVFDSQNGVVTRRVCKYTFDGTEGWSKGSTTTSAGMHRYYLDKDIGMNSGYYMDGFCNIFENAKQRYNTTTKESVFFGLGNARFQYLSSTEIPQAEIKSTLNSIFNDSVSITFIIKTPYTEFATPQQIAFQHGTNNLIQVSSSVGDTDAKVTYNTEVSE